ncbi:hypothetical protein FGADI_12409 [Fusarium gaditjirri]|uniref:BTB domain-containing protein n=1 Tax=Fusarium gaditjirri TaxID=282569 RepID=A0A8H4SS68_9HYPO|nr:hypothetical protein FGADI_12409 [Fusarium gaditjirri]
MISKTNTMDQAMKRRAPNEFHDKDSTKSIAKSKVFTFVVGPNKTEFTIHSALVANQSPVLNVLVNGPFKEASEQRVMWTDLDEATFLSFWEFAYGGNYTSPIQEDEGHEDTDPVDEELGYWGKSWAHYVRLHPRDSEHANANPHGACRFWKDFVEKYRPVSVPCEVGRIGADTLLHHARVYAFADRYIMDKLMEISFGKLFFALQATLPGGDSWNTVKELLVFTSGKFVPARLRQIVADYIICHAELFTDEEVFQNFMWSHRGPMRELLSQIVARESGEFTGFAFVCEGYTVLDNADLFTQASMFTLADKYDIQGLVKQAIDLYIRRLKQKDVKLEDFLSSLPVLHELPISVSRDAFDAAVVHTRETLLTCICRKAPKGLINQTSEASQEFLTELMVSIMVHKVIVCSQSKVFHAACTEPFKESSTNEFDLSEFSVDHDSALADHIYMFAMGDMYSIEPLAQYAADKFRVGMFHLMKLEEVLPLIPLVYNSTPEHRQELREQVVKFMRSPVRRIKEAMESGEWYDDVAEQCPDFIKDLLFSYLEWSNCDWSIFA